MNKDELHLKQTVQRLNIDTTPPEGHKERLRKQMLAAFAESQNVDTKPTTRLVSIGSKIMKHKLTRVAAMLLVALTVFVLLPESKQGVVWGEILDRMAEIPQFSFSHTWSIQQEQGDPQVFQSKIYVSQTQGMRQDLEMNNAPFSQIFIPKQGTCITQLLLTSKKVIYATLSEDQWQEMEKRMHPRHWLEDIENFHHIELEAQEIDNQKVVGVEIDDSAYMAGFLEEAKARIWVDPETELPVRIEIEGSSAQGGMTTRMEAYDFNWQGDNISSDLFEPNIPDDFEIGGDVSVSDDLETARNGLRQYSIITGGQYPTSLDQLTATREAVMTLMMKRALDPTDDEERDPAMPFNRQETEELVAIKAACNFYGKLMRDANDVVYYGEKILASHPDKVLLRWQDKPGEYQVVFGDLHVETLKAAVLHQLEADLEFKALLEGERPPLPFLTNVGFKGHQRDRVRVVNDERFEVTSTLDLIAWSKDGGGMDIVLPYKHAVLEKVTFGDRALSFKSAKTAHYRINVPVEELTFPPVTPIKCHWSLRAPEIRSEEGVYQYKLNTLIPAQSFSVTIVLSDGCGFVYPAEPERRQWSPFNAGDNGKFRRNFGGLRVTLKEAK